MEIMMPLVLPATAYLTQRQLRTATPKVLCNEAMYACLVRAAPMAADQRMKNDLLVPAEKLGKEVYSKNLLTIIDRCMSLDHMQRPQSVFSLQKALREDVPLDDRKTNIIDKLKDYLHKQ